MSGTPGYTDFEPVDFHATSALVHSGNASQHAQSAMEKNSRAYLSHLDAAEAHDAAAKAHVTTSKNVPLPENASPPDEGTPIPTTHKRVNTPETTAKITVPKDGKKV